MKLLALEEPYYAFLLHVFEAYVRGGLPTEELALAADTFHRLKEAREIPVDELMKQAKVVELSPNGVALEVNDPETPV